MRVVLATGERFSGSLVHTLIGLGHTVVAVILPARDGLHNQFESIRFFFNRRRWDLQKACQSNHIEFRVNRHLEDGALTDLVAGALDASFLRKSG